MKSLVCPPDVDGRMVYENFAVSILLYEAENSRIEIIFVALVSGSYDWFIGINNDEDGWQRSRDIPCEFSTLAECVNDVIEFIKHTQGALGSQEYLPAISKLEKFLAANRVNQ